MSFISYESPPIEGFPSFGITQWYWPLPGQSETCDMSGKSILTIPPFHHGVAKTSEAARNKLPLHSPSQGSAKTDNGIKACHSESEEEKIEGNKKRKTYLDALVSSLSEESVKKMRTVKDEEVPTNFEGLNHPVYDSTRKILLSGAFVRTTEDLSKSKDKYGCYIGETQGSPSLRTFARTSTLIYPEALSPYFLRRIGSVCLRNFRILQLKRVAHALNLSGKVNLRDGTSFQLSGFSESFTLPMIASSLQQYSIQQDAIISPESGTWISNVLNSSISNDSYAKGDARLLRNKIIDSRFWDPVSISSGYDWHVTHIFFFRGFLIYCNRGAGSGDAPGIQVFKIPNRRLVTSDLLAGLGRRHASTSQEWGEKYDLSALKKSLHLQPVFNLKMRSQTTGNCSYISTKTAVRALLAISKLMNQFENKSIPAKHNIWREAFNQTRKQYKEWSSFDKNLVICDLMNDVRHLKEDTPLITSSEFVNIFRMVKEKVTAKPEKYEKVSAAINSLEL